MKKRKLSKAAVCSVIIAAVVAVLVAALLLINIFIPVKYLSAYVVFKKEGLPADSARVTFLDIGQGDCILVELPDGKTMLIDGGDGRYQNELKLLKLLNARGVKTLDYLVCSSVKSEHCGGLADLIRYKSVGKIYSPYCLLTEITEEFRAFTDAAEASGAERAWCEYGAGERGDGWSFVFLSPTIHTAQVEGAEYYDLNTDQTAAHINNASAVLWLDCAGVKFLFLSDSTAATAEKIVQAYEVNALPGWQDDPVRLEQCDVITLAMHGGADGAYAPLMDIAAPQTAVVSVGNNGEGAPATAALTAAQRLVGNELYRTDNHGTVTVTVSGGTYSVDKEKT